MFTIPKEIKGIIFDCDGTLADSMPLHWQAWHGTLADFSIEVPHDFLEIRKGVPTRLIIGHVNQHFGHSVDEAAFASAKSLKFRELIAQVKPILPVVEVARSHRGIMPMAVASGGSRHNVHKTLEAIEVFDWFDVIVTADDPVKPKPDPEIFLEAARLIKIDPELCLVFEDADSGIDAANAAGMQSIDVRQYLGSKAA